MKGSLFVFGILTILGAPLFGQDSAPYVSKIEVQAEPGSIMVTWKDAEGYPGASYEVWRSGTEISRETFSGSQLVGTVASGVEAFEDKTLSQPSFYLVLLKDSKGNRVGYYIPFRNKTTSAIFPTALDPSATAVIVLTAVEYQVPQVQIRFRIFPADRTVTVFRSTNPIRSTKDLATATRLGSVAGSLGTWSDTPAAGIEFFYAVADAKAAAELRGETISERNVSSEAVIIPLIPVKQGPTVGQNPASDAPVQGERPIPLPRLKLDTEPDSGKPLPVVSVDSQTARPLSPEAQKALAPWQGTTDPMDTQQPPPIILPEERASSATGNAQYLVQIQKAYVTGKDWSGAERALRNVLKLDLDSELQIRTHFYLAEALYFQQKNNEAFVEFLMARNQYPAETRPFLDSLFNRLSSDQP